MKLPTLDPTGKVVMEDAPFQVVLWHEAMLKNRALVTGAALLFAALLIPHVVRAINATGTPWGLVTYTGRFAGRRYIGQGLLQYLGWLPFALAGPLAGATMVVVASVFLLPGLARLAKRNTL